ncbi:hypothetical protein [Altererythrobacter sp. MF3-039]|uniref:hypothetical protein n=1 Tax=Altererythrobacter sp. MF3-039 TaxID=3252901 RepID=UPI00390C72C3
MSDRGALAETSFARLAEEQGDITRQVIEHYYRICPGARASFAYHGLDNVPELEGRMVAETVFLLMQWAADPTPTQVEQGTTICHHQDTLEVGPHWYIGLVDAVLAVLFETIPADADEERAVWRAIRVEIVAFIESVRSEFWRKEDEGPLPPFDL